MATYNEFDQANVLVTGGAQGIGEAIVRSFAKQGARVFFCDIDSDRGMKLAEETGTTFTELDLADEDATVEGVETIASEAGELQTLINNAGRDPRIPLPELTAEKFDHLFATNLRAMAVTSRAAAPFLRKTGPGSSIINLSSVTFHIAPAGMAAYVATKAGIQGFTRALARELGPDLIRVNCISPGWVMTERQLSEYVNDDIVEMLKERQCDPRLIDPVDIAEVALFLASDASRAITGQEILADKGQAHS